MSLLLLQKTRRLMLDNLAPNDARGEDAPRGYQEVICVATLVSSNVLKLLPPKQTSASRI